MINFGALILAVGFTGLGGVLWAYGWFHRMNAWAFGAGAWFWVLAVAPWLALLASWTASEDGLVGLVFVDIATGIGFLAEAIHGAKYHRLRTPLITFTFGTALVLSVARWHQIRANIGHGFSFSGKGLNHAIHSIRSGQAAATVTPNNRLIYAVAVLLLVAALIWVAAKLTSEKHKPKLRTASPKRLIGSTSAFGGSHRPALPVGRGSDVVPTGRKR